MSREPSVSERFAEIDAATMKVFGPETVARVMADIRAFKLSLKEVANRSGVSCADVAQICRFHKIDINGNTLTH